MEHTYSVICSQLGGTMKSIRHIVRGCIYTLSLEPLYIKRVSFEKHLVDYVSTEFNILNNSIFQTSPLYLLTLVSAPDIPFHNLLYFFSQVWLYVTLGKRYWCYWPILFYPRAAGCSIHYFQQVIWNPIYRYNSYYPCSRTHICKNIKNLSHFWYI